ncbi:CRISPR-associated endonuclease Cas2 [Marinilongibacter aquaticus]|uniref:CRISPR-associated endonuclease Cas2 n=1 Tax=Marinilongibacter aquaticus TaxID=2975157 RepID=UPI0021BD5714|nr:CRISPR-associated endonuclease Cas2 [Marinilongibacter aquaticus]UBM57213.1 CRISPR-associated endonuclease Cas2 [Marinilongibacter aquaticus]
MYVILVYDIGKRRVTKMLKHCRKYLNWIQNSVFEGEISKARLTEMLDQAYEIMDDEEDSIIVFKSKNKEWLEKEILGFERQSTSNML